MSDAKVSPCIPCTEAMSENIHISMSRVENYPYTTLTKDNSTVHRRKMGDIRAAFSKNGLVIALLSYIVAYTKETFINLGCDDLEQVKGRPTLFTPCFQVM